MWSTRAGLILLCWLWPMAGFAANLAFTWEASIGATGYRLYCRLAPAAYSSFVDVGNVLSGTVTGLTANTLYYCTVTGYNTEGESPFSQEVGQFTGPTTPTAPSNLRQVSLLCRTVRLRWNAAVDDLAVTQYRIRRGGVQVGTTTPPTLIFTDDGLSPSTAYAYTVRAADASANESADSNTVNLTTPACP